MSKRIENKQENENKKSAEIKRIQDQLLLTTNNHTTENVEGLKWCAQRKNETVNRKSINK